MLVIDRTAEDPEYKPDVFRRPLSSQELTVEARRAAEQSLPAPAQAEATTPISSRGDMVGRGKKTLPAPVEPARAPRGDLLGRLDR